MPHVNCHIHICAWLAVIECPVLSPPINGTIELPSVRTSGTVAVYSCRSDLVLVGNGQRVCLDDGTWNGTEPSCIGMSKQAL